MRTEPVLLVHGWGASSALTWRQNGWIDLLGDVGREVITVDLLGHGEAPKPHDPAAYADLTARVRDALPSEGQVDAVGFSMGAMTLLRLASAAPERFARIVVAGVGDGAFIAGDPDGPNPLADAVESGVADDDDARARAFVQYARTPGNDPVALAACLRRVGAAMTEADLGRITCPVLVVLGAQDFAGPADRLVAALPDGTLQVLPKLDHFATPKDFRFLDAALGFLDALPS